MYVSSMGMYWYVLVCTWHIPICTCVLTHFYRYLGLLGDHIVPAVLHHYTQLLWRPDLVDLAKEIVPDWNEVWSTVNCIMMSMYLYILSTYLYVLVCTKRHWKVERRHTGDVELWQMRLGVLNEYMVVHKQTNAAWLPRTVHVGQPVHTSMYLVFTGYIESPKSFWGYYVFTFDHGIRYCVYWTGMWWCLQLKQCQTSWQSYMS